MNFGFGPNAALRTAVNKATEDNRTPPSGFQMQELAKKTVQSLDDCHTVEDLLLKRLQKDRPYIKKKTLRVIKYICENGRSEFRVAWQRHSDIVRACGQYRGQTDPVYGMTPYEDVRKVAKECMQAIFASKNKNTSAVRERITGLGSDPSAGPSAPSSSAPSGMYGGPTVAVNSGSKMQGFGNTPYNPDKPANKWTNKIQNWVNKQAEPKHNFQPHRPAPTYAGVTPSVLSQAASSRRQLDTSSSRGTRDRKKGEVGGVWGNAQANTLSQPASSVPSYGGNPAPATQSFGNPAPARQKSPQLQSQSDGVYETRVVNQLVQAGGIKPAPSKEELDKFYRVYPSLDQDHVHEALEGTLFDAPDSHKLRALYVIEGILKKDFEGEMHSFFKSHPDCLKKLGNHSKRSLRNKCLQVLKQLGMDASAVASASASPPRKPQGGDLLSFGAAPAQAAPAPPQNDLLGDLLSETTSPTAAVAPPPTAVAAPAEASGGSLFAGLGVAPAPEKKEPNALDWLDGNPVAAAKQAAPEQKPGSFDPLSFGAAPAAQPAAVAAPAPAASQPAASGFDFLGSAAPAPAAKPAAAALSDPFAGMNISAPAPAAAPAAAPASSGFGFLNAAPAAAPSQPASSVGFMSAGPPMGQSSGFGFMHQPAAQAQPAPASGFGLAAPAQASGFGFMNSPAKPASGFGLSPANSNLSLNPQNSGGSAMRANDPFGSLLNNSGKQQSMPAARPVPAEPKKDPFANLAWS